MKQKLIRIASLLLAVTAMFTVTACGLSSEMIDEGLSILSSALEETSSPAESTTSVTTVTTLEATTITTTQTLATSKEPATALSTDATTSATTPAETTTAATTTKKTTAETTTVTTPPETTTATATTVKLWFRTKNLRDQHYEKHGREMGFASAEAYLDAANKVVYDPNALHKLSTDGDDVYYIQATNDFVVVSADGYIRTYFWPSAGIDYYNRQ